MKRIFKHAFMLIIILIIGNNVYSQQNVFSRSDVSSLWWDGANPWYYETWASNESRPDRVEQTRNDVFIGHNSNNPMTVNGAFFQLRTLTLQVGITTSRIFNASDGGGISLGVGLYNTSTSTHTFNTPIGVDGTTVTFDASSGDLSFTTNFYINANTAAFTGANDVSISGIMSGTDGNVTKSGSGILTLSETNTYTGTTTVSAGTLELQGSIASSDVTVQSGATLKINGTEVTVASLTVESGGIVNIEAGKSLTVTGELSNSGTLTIKSTASGTGSLITNGTVSGSGSVTVERYIPANSLDWFLVSSPVNAQGISGVWTPTGEGNAYDFYAYQELNAIWVNRKNTIATPVGDVGPRFDDAAVNGNLNFNPGSGYMVAYEFTENPVKSFVGSLNSGNVAVSVSKANSGDYAGANLIGNPYPSGIDWHLATRTLFEDNFAYVYDRESSEEGITVGYKTINGTNSGAYIAANQGFFVIKKDAGEGPFTFTNTMRVHNGTFYKSPTNIDQMVLLITNGSYYDETTLAVNEGATFNRDRTDAIKMFSYNASMPQIYTVTEDNRQVAINSMPDINVEKTISMGAVIPVVGEYSMKLTEIGESFSNKVIFLKDLKTGFLHNLTKDGDYTFTSEENDDPDRFELHFGVVGINDQPTTPAIQAYVVGQQLKVLGAGGVTQLEIFDVQGRLLSSETINVTNGYSKTLNLQAGMYVVRLQNEAGVSSTKVIIN